MKYHQNYQNLNVNSNLNANDINNVQVMNNPEPNNFQEENEYSNRTNEDGYNISKNNCEKIKKLSNYKIYNSLKFNANNLNIPVCFHKEREDNLSSNKLDNFLCKFILLYKNFSYK